MIIKINLESNRNGWYEVFVDNDILYRVENTGNAERFSILTDQYRRPILSSKLQQWDDPKWIIPEGWLPNNEEIEDIFAVLGHAGVLCGMFCKILYLYEMIRCEDSELEVYRIEKGKSTFMPIYRDDLQIGQINKKFGRYVLYLPDSYSEFMEICILYIINFDRIHPNHQTSGWEWTLGIENDKYDPKWLPAHFGDIPEEVAEKVKMNKHTKIVLLANGIVWAVAIVAFALMYFVFHVF